MRRRMLAVLLVTFGGLTTVVMVIPTTWAPKIAYAQTGSCPDGWSTQGIYNCITMPPPPNDTLVNFIEPDDHYSSAFNGSDFDCVILYDNFENAYNQGRVLTADMPINTWGKYTGQGDEHGTLAIANATLDSGNEDFTASIAIHESAHDLGCTDSGYNSAQSWADYCVPVNFPPPPPPPPCSDLMY